MVCPANMLSVQCQLSDPTTVTTMFNMRIQQRNISELYEDVVTISLSTGSGDSNISWQNDTIKNISLTDGSSINPGNESILIVQINLNGFEWREDSTIFRCTIFGGSPPTESIQDRIVRKEEIGKFC